MLTQPDKQQEFSHLFAEFKAAYLEMPDGRKHVTAYSAGRETPRVNYAQVVQVIMERQEGRRGARSVWVVLGHDKRYRS